MFWLAFDMDETLGSVTALNPFICSLHHEKSESKQLHKDLDVARANFVKGLAQAEMSNKPLGFLRPGLISIFETIVKMKKQKKVGGVIIYTNNNNKLLINLVRDVIETALDGPVFDDVIDWEHPIRKPLIGDSIWKNSRRWKNWNEIYKLFTQSKCQAPQSIEPKDVLFFDDLRHMDLYKTLKQNYFQVPAYNYHVEPERLLEIYKKALPPTLYSESAEFVAHSKACTKLKFKDIDDELKHISQRNPNWTYKSKIPNGHSAAIHAKLKRIINKSKK